MPLPPPQNETDEIDVGAPRNEDAFTGKLGEIDKQLSDAARTFVARRDTFRAAAGAVIILAALGGMALTGKVAAERFPAPEVSATVPWQHGAVWMLGHIATVGAVLYALHQAIRMGERFMVPIPHDDVTKVLPGNDVPLSKVTEIVAAVSKALQGK